jgi:hypothetical protein
MPSQRIEKVVNLVLRQVRDLDECVSVNATWVDLPHAAAQGPYETVWDFARLVHFKMDRLESLHLAD